MIYRSGLARGHESDILDVAWFHSWRIYLPLGVSHGQLSTTWPRPSNVGAFFLFHSKQKDEYVEDCHAAHDQDRALEQSGVGKMALIFFNDEKQKDSE